MIIEQASISDADEILAPKKLAFLGQAQIYNDYKLPALLQTKDQIIDELNKQMVLKLSFNGKIVGSVKAYSQGETCYIGGLIVHPDYQNKGLGTRLMNEIEKIFKYCQRYELFTGHKSEKNIYLYQKLGYKIFDTKKVNDNLSMLFMEKNILDIQLRPFSKKDLILWQK